jgi:hypothetical protein
MVDGNATGPISWSRRTHGNSPKNTLIWVFFQGVGYEEYFISSSMGSLWELGTTSEFPELFTSFHRSFYQDSPFFNLAIHDLKLKKFNMVTAYLNAAIK